MEARVSGRRVRRRRRREKEDGGWCWNCLWESAPAIGGTARDQSGGRFM